MAVALIAGPARAVAQTARRTPPDTGLARVAPAAISGDTAGMTPAVLQRLDPTVGVHLVYLEHAKAADLAPQLQRLLVASRFVAEQSSNALLVRTTDSDWKLIRLFIQAVDM